ncbi:MAG TPA: hypothetical protein VK686_02130 [Bryobacteraceae bacterium]|jgi:hypothetical protein|nr:hypothetical protein [Bryobacteraceae bacterium]
MREPDPLHALLEEWKAPEPSHEFDRRVAAAYRMARPQRTILGRFWRARVSVPAPIFGMAILVAVMVFIWFRVAATPSPSRVAPNVVTYLNATGFQPLPNGAARVVSIKELKK